MIKKPNEKIIRHSASERINHWLVVIFFLFTAISGLGFFFPSLNWLMNILGTPQLSRVLHPFLGAMMFVLFVGMFIRYFKHNFIDKQDIIWAKNIDKISKNQEVGDVGQYNLGQKAVFWLATICLFLLLISGIIIWRPYFSDYFPIPIIRLALLLHSVAAIGLIMTIIIHVYAAIWVKGSILAMVEGWVTRAWAKKHHPRWYREIVEKEKPQQEKSS
ncbi:formate dehydrogenase cytochrome b556 subunit [Arsenophonus endosymbiont of Aphis craccivora]|uniref:formate dehydrogenase cytochrome b556 subunit n=1 Tax=Arsenophonus endosymbiont of Aphis craccivora TaxID=1231049 RepID=UPI0015DC7BB6|nr:formate dehydrogenase cytochrome b556 subunit [Arsenophonus endosymbiont of Aphis craccivora]QLK87888.1 formate dehydrogenase cytochrome b556 subunit [Arsenophonus endosymbiont of Aphis craccivora]